MNISPISMVSKSPNFAKNWRDNHDSSWREDCRCKDCESDEPMVVSQMGSDSFMISASQVKQYEENYRRSREAIDAHNTSAVDSAKDYADRRLGGE